MKALFSFSLLLAAVFAAAGTPDTNESLPPIVKHAPAPGGKSQPGPANRPKDRTADSRLMAAQPHLIPKAVNTPKTEVRDETR